MGITGITGLRFYLTWLSNLFYSTLCSAKAQTSGEGRILLLIIHAKTFYILGGLFILSIYCSSYQKER